MTKIVPLRPLPKRNALPEALEFRDWADKKCTIPAPTLWNARVAIAKLGISFTHNLFDGKKYIGGMELNSEVGGQVTDDAVTAIEVMIRDRFDFDPGLNKTWQAVNLFCREHSYHPVRDYLESVRGKWKEFEDPERIDTMLIDYFGAPDTKFVRAVSRIVMVASVRRIYEPGCKFDYITVLESPEGYNKSTALRKLYGDEWFTDNSILGLSAERLQETVTGFWCVECADLSGMHKSEVERVKNQLSKCEDSTRGAYKRATVRAPRSCVFWGTTNDTEYLRSLTGNRRFFPIPVKRIDIERLIRDRDMLWSEALAINDLRESILLPEEAWIEAGIEQSARTIGEPWVETVRHASDLARAFTDKKIWTTSEEHVRLGTVYEQTIGNDGEPVERIASAFVLGKVIGISEGQQTAEHGKRLGFSMRSNKWVGSKAMRIGGRTVKGFERKLADAPSPGDPANDDRMAEAARDFAEPPE
jgi:predicted P-loop ATPase